ncbi:SUN2 protein, partial [Dromaius novaehollandiae]|nr:SUN2 protein [Dromaius novaehollandiae]
VTPGQCWPFRGCQGQVVIKLPAQIQPTAVTVQDVSKTVSPSGSISSTPKDIAVSVSPCRAELAGGLDEEGEATLLGTFMYDLEREALQVFLLKNELHKAFQYIQIFVQSNWGNPEYTCIYRVQVPGKIATQN